MSEDVWRKLAETYKTESEARFRDFPEVDGGLFPGRAKGQAGRDLKASMTPAEPKANDAASLAELGFELWKGFALAPFAPPPALEAELRQLRARWFAELGAIVDESMRSAWSSRTHVSGTLGAQPLQPVVARLWSLAGSERASE